MDKIFEQMFHTRKYMCEVHETSLFIREMKIKTLMALLAEKAMATHSSTLAWKIPWTEEPVRLQSMGC